MQHCRDKDRGVIGVDGLSARHAWCLGQTTLKVKTGGRSIAVLFIGDL